MGTKIIDFDQLFELNFPKLISLIIQKYKLTLYSTKDVHDIRLMNMNILAKFHPKTEKLFSNLYIIKHCENKENQKMF